MNIINKVLLRFFLWPKFFYKRLGINVAHLSAILTIKLTMDDRRPNTFQHVKSSKKETPVNKATLGTMALSALMGCLYLVSFFAGSHPATHVTLFFCFFMVFLSLTLITDFTEILIDVRDNQIILPKPVNDVTFVTARILHIGIHICKIMLPMSLPSLILVGVTHGFWALFVFFVATALATVFILFIINALYLVILKVSSPEKFKNIISYIQIGFAILIYGGYQIVPRLFENSIFNNLDLGSKPQHLLLPPYWFAGFWSLFSGIDSPTYLNITAAVLAFLAPVVGVIAVIKYFAPLFNQKLSLLSGASAEVSTKTKSTAQAESGYRFWLANWATKNGPERMGFLFTWNMMVRSRDFKMKVYPGIGYLIVITVANTLRSKTLSLSTFNFNDNPVVVITTLYFSSLIVLSAVGNVSQSNHFKAAWIFNIAPMQQPGKILSGTIKALILQFVMPIALIFIVFALVTGTPMLLLHIFAAFSIQLTLLYAVFLSSGLAMPFSKPMPTGGKSLTVFKTIFIFSMASLFGVLQYFIKDTWWAVALMGFVGVIVTVVLQKKIALSSWRAIQLHADF